MKQEKEHFHVFEKKIEDEKVIHYDVCVLGGGPAGLTSALYSARYGLHTALITKNIGGMANLAEKIENYPGFEGTGYELMQKFFKQAKNSGTEFLSSEVGNLYRDKTGFVIELKNGKVVHSKTIIIALGTEKRKLNIKGEDKFLGKGVSYCATCDAPLFKNKIVAVIGGRNSAAKATLLLSRIAKKIYLIYRRESLRCDKIEELKIRDNKKIALVLNAIPLVIKGKENVTGIEIMKEGEGKKQIKLDGVFVEIGSIPVSGITKKLGIRTDKKDYIIVDNEMKTNVKGIFAAGDIVKSKLKQVVVSAAQGAIAARSAYEFVDRK